MLNLSNLATLVAILDKGSFTAAAGVIGCTPSAVSLQVKQLEMNALLPVEAKLNLRTNLKNWRTNE